MKLIDKFLKKLNVNRNTFATYILTLLTVYLAVDRIVEMLLDDIYRCILFLLGTYTIYISFGMSNFCISYFQEIPNLRLPI